MKYSSFHWDEGQFNLEILLIKHFQIKLYSAAVKTAVGVNKHRYPWEKPPPRWF